MGGKPASRSFQVPFGLCRAEPQGVYRTTKDDIGGWAPQLLDRKIDQLVSVISASGRPCDDSFPSARRALSSEYPAAGGQLGQRWYVHDRPPAAPVAAEPYKIAVLF